MPALRLVRGVVRRVWGWGAVLAALAWLPAARQAAGQQTDSAPPAWQPTASPRTHALPADSAPRAALLPRLAPELTAPLLVRATSDGAGAPRVERDSCGRLRAAGAMSGAVGGAALGWLTMKMFFLQVRLFGPGTAEDRRREHRAVNTGMLVSAAAGAVIGVVRAPYPRRRSCLLPPN